MPAYRIVLEEEINRWRGFARALRREDREAFEELMDACRTYASESSCATNPIVFEPMVMSILLGQQRRIRELERKLQAIQPAKVTASSVEEVKLAEPIEPIITVPPVTKGSEQARLG
jgi:hypothetical protein